MYISPISRSYWRLIKENERAYNEVVGEDKKKQVKWLAQQEVVEGKLMPEQYAELIGEEYPESETEESLK